MFQSPCGDLLIGNHYEIEPKLAAIYVSVPLRGFINRKLADKPIADEPITEVSVPLRGFINRKPLMKSGL